MRVNLLINNSADIRNGYLNIDPLSEDDTRIKGDVSNLNHAVDAGEAEEIVAYGILDYFPGAMVDEILDNWLSKLAHGGTITIGVIDAKEVSRAFVAGMIELEEVNTLMHGEQEEKWQIRKSSFTLNQLSEVLSNRGYKILKKRIQNFRAYVTAQRP